MTDLDVPRPLSERAQDLIALTHYVKANVLVPLMETSQAEIAARDRASERELALAERQLGRQHQMNLLLAVVVAVIVLLVIGCAVYLIVNDKETAGMWLFTSIVAVAGGGGAVYGISHRSKTSE